MPEQQSLSVCNTVQSCFRGKSRRPDIQTPTWVYADSTRNCISKSGMQPLSLREFRKERGGIWCGKKQTSRRRESFPLLKTLAEQWKPLIRPKSGRKTCLGFKGYLPHPTHPLFGRVFNFNIVFLGELKTLTSTGSPAASELNNATANPTETTSPQADD